MLSDRAIRRSVERYGLDAGIVPGVAPPRLQVLLDASLSMTAGDGSKEKLARELALVLLQCSERAGVRGTVYAIRGRQRDRAIEAAEAARLTQVPFDGSAGFLELLSSEPPSAAAGTLRVLVSDFLSPADPAPPLSAAAAGAARLWVIQILDEWELNPEPLGPIILSDLETEEELELVLDRAAIEQYRARLTALRASLERACQAAGAELIGVSASLDLEALCGTRLAPSGLLRARELADVQTTVSPGL